MTTAGNVAKYYLWTFGDHPEEPISNLKIQKLLYYGQGWHLAKFDEPLFDETIDAWKHGPVVPSVYHAYKCYDDRGIPKPETFDISLINNRARSLLNNVYKAYGQYAAWKLREMTHEESPWVIAWAEGDRSSISLESMREFFRARLRITPQSPYTLMEAKIHSYVDESVQRSGRQREATRLTLARLIQASHCKARYAEFATKLIFAKYATGERVDEAVDLLVSSGPETVRHLVSEALALTPPNEDNGDHWYILIRAMGLLGMAGQVADFATSPYIRIREAVVEALSDLGDEYSLNLLKAFGTNDRSKFIQRIATTLSQERSAN